MTEFISTKCEMSVGKQKVTEVHTVSLGFKGVLEHAFLLTIESEKTKSRHFA